MINKWFKMYASILQYQSITILKDYNVTISKDYGITILQYHNTAISQYCKSTKAQFQNIKIFQNYELSKKAANMLYFDNVRKKATVIGFI